MQFVELVENTAIAVWVRESTSIFGYTTILSLHAMGLAIVVGLSTVIALRIVGYLPTMPLAPTTKLFPLIYAGFWINAISGLLLLAANASTMVENTMFYIKLALIGCSVASLRSIRNRVFTDGAVLAGGEPSDGARRLAWASIFFWLAAIVAGRLTAYPHFVETWFGI